MVQAEAIQGRDPLSYAVVRLARLERAMEAEVRVIIILLLLLLK